MTKPLKSLKKLKFNKTAFLYQFVITVLILALATLANYIIVFLYQKTTNVSGMYLLSVIIVSCLTGRYFWGIVSSIYSVVATNFFFMYPFFGFDFSLTGYPLTLLVMATSSIITCALTVELNQQRNRAQQREKMAHLMNEMDRRLLRADMKDEIIMLLMEHLFVQVERPVLYLEQPDGEFVFLETMNYTEQMSDSSVKIEEKNLPEYYKNAQISLKEGRIVRTDSLSECDEGILCMPIMWQKRVFGTVCIVTGEDALPADIQEYAQGLINHFAIAFDHQALRESQRRILMEKQEEQIRGSLLRSISHDLRTPLTGILGASGSILENGDRMQPELRNKLLKDIHEEAHWLLRMIENVLSVTKIGNRAPELKKSLEPVEEVIADSVARCKKYFPDLKIEIYQPEELIMLPMDPVLIRQVVTNLIDNAYRHGKSSQKIELAVTRQERYVEISVQDYGPGMAAEDLQHVFRGLGRRKQQDGDGSRGLGLGVSICKTIVEAHNGQIGAENVAGKGLKVSFRLPVGEME